jgi:acetolactate synthase I/II/III large subunit
MQADGNAILIATLKSWGIHLFAGVNGGGIIHLTKLLPPYSSLEQSVDGESRFFTMFEYVSGFTPLGYFLASGKMSACLVTTGAAIKLASCGMTDAKLHNIPALYLIALNPTFSTDYSPLQDVSIHGMHIVPQLQAELGEGFFLIDSINTLEEKLAKAYEVLSDSRPVAIAFHPDILCQTADMRSLKLQTTKKYEPEKLNFFIKKIQNQPERGRIVLYVCSEAAREPDMASLTTKLAERLQAPTVWSVNGANGVSADNPLGYGYISLGGNDRALQLWRSLGSDDWVIALGLDTGEYSLNLNPIPAGTVWHFTDWNQPYGSINRSFQHRAALQYFKIKGKISDSIEHILQSLPENFICKKAEHYITLNTRDIHSNIKEGCVDLIAFYEAIYKLWQPNSIGFDDVCVSYRDRQYITQRPHPNIRFHTTHDGSAMGGAFGLGVGAKLACPWLNTFIFSGDGCWRLYGGAIAEAATFDIRLFILNNQSYAIVDQGLKVVLPKTEKARRHSQIAPIDFVKAAQAHGWRGVKLNCDLSNLAEIMELCYQKRNKSILIEIPVDPNQIVGGNPRYENLSFETYL